MLKSKDLFQLPRRRYEKTKIQAFQAIGVAYGKGQQPNIIITNLRKH